MPRYVYRVIRDYKEGEGEEIFELIQMMKDPPLKVHPISGEPVQRVYQAPNLASKYTPGQTKNKLDNRNVEKAGFTKYERDKLTGRFNKVAGKTGPDSFDKPPPGLSI